MPGSLIDKGFRIPQMTNGFLLSEMMNANEHVQNDIPKWVRVIAIAIGILLVSVMALVLLGVAVDLLSDGSESWFTQVSMALFAALVGVISARLPWRNRQAGRSATAVALGNSRRDFGGALMSLRGARSTADPLIPNFTHAIAYYCMRRRRLQQNKKLAGTAPVVLHMRVSS